MCPTSIGGVLKDRRTHAYFFLLAVTLASDIEVWETASEGFSSSLVGTSPGCSLAECANSSTSTAVTVKTEDDDDDIDDGKSPSWNARSQA